MEFLKQNPRVWSRRIITILLGGGGVGIMSFPPPIANPPWLCLCSCQVVGGGGGGVYALYKKISVYTIQYLSLFVIHMNLCWHLMTLFSNVQMSNIVVSNG